MNTAITATDLRMKARKKQSLVLVGVYIISFFDVNIGCFHQQQL